MELYGEYMAEFAILRVVHTSFGLGLGFELEVKFTQSCIRSGTAMWGM